MAKEKEKFKSHLESLAQDFSSLSYGKWILAGEHSVLRGVPALVFPLHSRFMKFQYKKTGSSFQLKYKGVENELFYELFMGLLDRVKSYLKMPQTFSFQGELMIENNIPIGEGLGASAAFCVNMARWLHFLGFLKEDKLFSFAKTLEDLFHGESSGIDIAVALEGKALRFKKNKDASKNEGRSEGRNGYKNDLRDENKNDDHDDQKKSFYTSLNLKWNPFFYLSHSGKKSLTSHCVKYVKGLIKKDPVLGDEMDQLMRKSVSLAEEALKVEKSDESVKKLSEALNLSQTCFKTWGLLSHSLERKMQDLLSWGALAVKPTGSGDGGFILSLWQDIPDRKYLDFLIPCYKRSPSKHSLGLDLNSPFESSLEI